MHYEIKRAHNPQQKLTNAQRSSGIFAEEPVVLGKVLRRGMKPLIVSADIFRRNRTQLVRQLLAGSIKIEVVDEKATPVRQSYASYAAQKRDAAPLPLQVGEVVPASPASSEEQKTEESKAVTEPSSSAATGAEEP